MARPTRDDLEPWADEFFVGGHGLLKKKTFGCPSYYLGRKMLAFLWKDGLGIKLEPATVLEYVAKDPDAYRPFHPGEGKRTILMKNWLIIVHPEAGDYDAERPLFDAALNGLRG